MNNTVLESLLVEARNEVQVTWADEETDKRLKRHIQNGSRLLKKHCGVDDEDLQEGGKANALFLAYVRRAFDGDISGFVNDYLGEIVDLQQEKEVENYEAETESLQ